MWSLEVTFGVLRFHASLFVIIISGVFSVNATAYGAENTRIIDRFDDGNDDGWSRIDTNAGQPWGPGEFEVTADEYRFSTPESVPDGAPCSGCMLSYWDASSHRFFSDGLVRAKVRVGEPESVAAILFRFSGDPLNGGANGYAFLGIGGGTFVYNKIVNTTVVADRLVDSNLRFELDEAWWIEGGVIGDQVSMKVWRDGDAEPERPQLSFRDQTYQSGQIAVDANVSFSHPPGFTAPVHTVFDEITFTSSHEPGDFNGDQVVDVTDIDQLTEAAASGEHHRVYDLNADLIVDQADIERWVDLRKTWIGDANVNGVFDSNDFVTVFLAGKYESPESAVWSEGDWTGDGVFNSTDFIAAFTDGGYEVGPIETLSVPEPHAACLLSVAGLFLMFTRRGLHIHQLWVGTKHAR